MLSRIFCFGALCCETCVFLCFFFFQAEDGIRDWSVTGVQTCALPILSEVSGETLRRAQAIHPITAVQSEYSIFSREIEQDVLPVCKETGTSLVAYSPLGRVLLTCRFKQDSPISETDFRGTSQPRFSGDAYAANLQLVDTILSLAAALDVSAAEVALAWVIAKQHNVLPIAGTTKLANLKTNLAAMELTLSPEAIASLDDLADRVEGTRYNEQGMTIVNA